jgi:type II secretory pathway component PulC
MIILGVMGIVVLYGAFDFLMPVSKVKPSANMTQKTAELNAFVTELTASLGKDTPKNLGTLIFSRAEKEWVQDPFLDNKSFRAWTQAKTTTKEPVAVAPPKIEFVYTGYIEVGKKRMAIINGSEYPEGENLDIKGYVLRSVSPTGVVIENRGIGATLNVPLQE